MGENVHRDDINIGSSIFWISLILIALMGLTYLMIWSFHANSVKGVVVASIFMFMIIAGVILSKFKVFSLANWGDNCLSFSLGFGLWTLLGKVFGSQSIISVSQNYLFATIASELPQIIEVVVNNFIVPIAEELFWMIGIPFALISIMNQIGKSYSVFENEWLQMGIVIVISSVTFAGFHIGKAFTAFMIASMIFRTIMIVLVYGEHYFDLLKGFNLVVGFSVGAHIANNILDTGFAKTLLVLQGSPVILWVIIAFFGLIFLSALNVILKFVMGKDNNLIAGD